MPCGAEPDEGVDAEHPPGMTKLQRSVSRAAGIIGCGSKLNRLSSIIGSTPMNSSASGCTSGWISAMKFLSPSENWTSTDAVQMASDVSVLTSTVSNGLI